MGVRLYNPGSGRFLSVDPIFGGNDNAYVYPDDPINASDPSGELLVPGGGGTGSSSGLFSYRYPDGCYKSGCWYAQEICNLGTLRCNFQISMRLYQRLWPVQGVTLFFTIRVNGKILPGFKLYQYHKGGEPGSYIWHFNLGSPITARNKRQPRGRLGPGRYIIIGDNIEIDMTGFGVWPDGRITYFGGRKHWSV